jgi:alpha-1,2-mannosyltransferase
LGQLNLVLVLLVTTIWALERSGRSSTAGLLLGAAAAIKLFPAYLALYYLAPGLVWPLLATALSFLDLTVVTALVLGLDTYRDYLLVVLPGQAKFQGFSYNQSIARLWRWAAVPSPSRLRRSSLEPRRSSHSPGSGPSRWVMRNRV